MARKNGVSPASSSTVSISGRFDDDASPSGNRSASRCTASTAPGTSGRCSRYAASIRSHDLGVDRVGLVRDAGAVVEVPRPFAGAHAHHRPLHLGVVAAAALAHVRLAHRVPDLLRVQQHAVEVEDRGVDHSAWYSLSR